MNQFDAIVLVTEEHLPMLEKMLPYCKKNVAPKNIYIIAPAEMKLLVDEIQDVIYVDESTVYPELNFNTIQDIIEKITGERKRSGWYLQQFLKMAWAYKCDDPCYVTIDADTFILNPVSFVSDDNKYQLTPKTEYHQPYFDTINKLFDDRVRRKKNCSFIAENMIFDCEIMKKMLDEIEANEKLPGHVFFEKILYAINPNDMLQSGFSEFETYGNYVFSKYPEKAMLRPLRTQREALVILGGHPTKEQLNWAARDYDVISVETANYPENVLTRLTKRRWFQNLFRMSKVAKIRHDIRSVYRRIIGKEDFQFEEY